MRLLGVRIQDFRCVADWKIDRGPECVNAMTDFSRNAGMDNGNC